ncbi:Uncharacterized protein PCOAH_00028190 [Plasmodium coatneyi]|uniref:SICA antigen n=1 Tax=Plasmodium coatneyi TaxID=208452 RepID=A0A1B1DZB2_9APIC|nr:Uncharacterized protein PCOAH_00028190 [Plasmodium coatneyi]ANQ08142.1 Uncharacterized protein PCOAH_00028190 [Plasmodium coatneyi]
MWTKSIFPNCRGSGVKKKRFSTNFTQKCTLLKPMHMLLIVLLSFLLQSNAQPPGESSPSSCPVKQEIPIISKKDTDTGEPSKRTNQNNEGHNELKKPEHVNLYEGSRDDNRRGNINNMMKSAGCSEKKKEKLMSEKERKLEEKVKGILMKETEELLKDVEKCEPDLKEKIEEIRDTLNSLQFSSTPGVPNSAQQPSESAQPPPKRGEGAAPCSITVSNERSELAQTTTPSTESHLVGTPPCPPHENGSGQGTDGEDVPVKLKELISKWKEYMDESGNFVGNCDNMKNMFEEFMEYMEGEDEELSAISTETKSKGRGVKEEYATMCKCLVQASQNTCKEKSKDKNEQVEKENDRVLRPFKQCIMMNVSTKNTFDGQREKKKDVEYVFKAKNNAVREIYGGRKYEYTIEDWRNIQMKWKEMEMEINNWLKENKNIISKTNDIKSKVRSKAKNKEDNKVQIKWNLKEIKKQMLELNWDKIRKMAEKISKKVEAQIIRFIILAYKFYKSKQGKSPQGQIETTDEKKINRYKITVEITMNPNLQSENNNQDNHTEPQTETSVVLSSPATPIPGAKTGTGNLPGNSVHGGPPVIRGSPTEQNGDAVSSVGGAGKKDSKIAGSDSGNSAPGQDGPVIQKLVIEFSGPSRGTQDVTESVFVDDCYENPAPSTSTKQKDIDYIVVDDCYENPAPSLPTKKPAHGAAHRRRRKNRQLLKLYNDTIDQVERIILYKPFIIFIQLLWIAVTILIIIFPEGYRPILNPNPKPLNPEPYTLNPKPLDPKS